MNCHALMRNNGYQSGVNCSAAHRFHRQGRLGCDSMVDIVVYFLVYVCNWLTG